MTRPNSFLSPKLEMRQRSDTGGQGIFALQPLTPGDLIAVWGGDVVDLETLQSLPEAHKRMTAQVEEGLFLVSSQAGPGDYVNHSCEPNAGMDGQISIVAMRSIEPGEEVCIDYAMVDGTPYDEFQCACGAKNCRGLITGDDWQRPELWERYAGYFSPYLKRRINHLRQANG